MSKGLRTIINILMWMALIAYLIIAVTYCFTTSSTKNVCNSLNVVVNDDNQKFVDADKVLNWLDSLRMPIVGTAVNSIDNERIESYLRTKPYIQTVDVFPTINGECKIEISQRNVIFRVISNSGYDFFVDTMGYVLNPAGQWQKKVPVITTDMDLSSDTKYFNAVFKDVTGYYFQKLSNFVNVLEKDDFLSSLVTQVRLTGCLKPGLEEVHLIPRVGKQVIILGNLQDIESKFKHLKTFYIKTFKDGWWQDAHELCFQYGNKVVVKRK